MIGCLGLRASSGYVTSLKPPWLGLLLGFHCFAFFLGLIGPPFAGVERVLLKYSLPTFADLIRADPHLTLLLAPHRRTAQVRTRVGAANMEVR